MKINTENNITTIKILCNISLHFNIVPVLYVLWMIHLTIQLLLTVHHIEERNFQGSVSCVMSKLKMIKAIPPSGQHY